MSCYLDANIVIYVVESNPAWGAQASARIAAFRGGGLLLAVSDLTRMECRVGPLRRGNPSLLAAFDAFFTMPYVTVLSVTAGVCDRAAQIRASYSFSAIDSLHLAAAMEHGCSRFFSNDGRLSRFTGLAVEAL